MDDIFSKEWPYEPKDADVPEPQPAEPAESGIQEPSETPAQYDDIPEPDSPTVELNKPAAPMPEAQPEAQPIAQPTTQPAPQPACAQPQYPAQGGYRPYPQYAPPVRPPYQQPAPQYAPQYTTQQAPYPYAQPVNAPSGCGYNAYGRCGAQPQAPAYYYPAEGAQPQQPQQPQPTDMNANPYAQPASPAQPTGPAYGYPYYAPAQPAREPKPKTSTGTKVFIIILIALLLAMLIGFIAYISYVADRDSSAKKNGAYTPDRYEDFFDKYSDDLGDHGGFSSDSFKEFDEEVTLVEDNGDTQKRTDDNPDSVGEPDEKAKTIELKALPKDKDDPKYTTQSAYEAVSDSVVTINLYQGEITENFNDIVGSGTGTVISSDGYIVTNAHVIANSRAYAVKVVMNSGESYQAKVVGYDTWTDLAVIKIDAKGLTPVEFGDSELIEIGQDVIAVGSPGGEKFRNSLTKGIVSAVEREISINKYVRYIQSDAAISPGNSGGPLCNIYGQVVGINTAKSTATNYEAMTFSIPSATVKDIVNDLLRYGYVKGRPRFGFTGTPVTSEEQSYGKPAGVYVNEIDPNGALAGTDIKEGDIITAVDGTDIKDFQDIYAILNEHKAGDKLTLSIYREE